MRACSDPCGAVIIFGRVGFDEGNEILHSARWERFVDRQHYHCGGRDRDRLEIPDRIIGNSVVKAWICCECNSIDDKDRIAVRRRLRRATRTDIAARAGHILDVELLAEPLGQLLCDKPPDRVSLTAGRKRHDNAHWPGRVLLRPRNARDRWQRGSARGQTENISAGKFHHVALPERLCSRRSAAHYSHCESVWMSVYGRLCCKRPKTSVEHFLARRQSKSRPPIDMASGSLPKSPVSSSPWDEVPHMFTRKPRLRPAKFSNPGAKRLLQHNRSGAEELDLISSAFLQ